MGVLELGWVSTAYLLAAAAFLVPFGRLSDIYGRKKIFVTGLLLDILSSMAGALAPSGTILIAARVFQGIGGGMILTLGVSIVTTVFPPERRGRALGFTVAAVYVGLSLGPFIGGFLTENIGWRSIYLANILIGLVILTSTLWKLKIEFIEARGEQFDFIGSLIYIGSLTFLMYGLSTMPNYHAFLLVILGIAGISIFITRQLKTESPLIDIHLFRHNKTFFFSNLAALINYSSTFAVTFLMSLYLQYVKGFSPQMTGIILVSQPVMMAVFSPPAGWLSERLGSRVMASSGMALTVAGLVWFIFLHPETHMFYLIGNLMILGFAFALFASPNTSAVMGSVDKKNLGIASGILSTMRLTGQMLSMGIVMVVFALFQVNTTDPTNPSDYSELVKGTRIIFLLFSLFCFAGIFVSLSRGSDSKPQENNNKQT